MGPEALSFLFTRTPFPALYITYQFWVMIHLRSVFQALLYAYLGESAVSLFLTVCGDRCVKFFGEPEPVTNLLIGDMLNRAIGIILLGATAIPLFRMPPLLPKLSWFHYGNWYILLKYTAQIYSVRIAGFLISRRTTVFGSRDYPLGHFMFTIIVFLLPIIFYFWNKKDFKPYVPDHLYLRTYFIASATMGFLNGVYLLKFGNSYIMAFIITGFILCVYIGLHYTFVVPEDEVFAMNLANFIAYPVELQPDDITHTNNSNFISISK